MDYGKVLKRAWEITWRWKVLWILGFLAALGNGGGWGGGNYSMNGQEMDLSRYTRHLGPDFWMTVAGVIAGLVCLLFIVAIAVRVVSLIARGGLIAGVQQVEDEGSTGFGQAWRVGRSRFWTLLGVWFLSALPAIAVLLGLVVAGLWAFFAVGAAAATGGRDIGHILKTMAPPGIVTAVCCGGVLCCGLILAGIVLDQIRVYAERAAILEGLGWIDAFKRGWQVIKDNLGPTVIFWLIFLVIGFMVVAVVFAILGVGAAPFIVLFSGVEPGWWMAPPICLGGLLAIVIFAFLSAIVTTFTSATWTLVYRELTAGEEVAPVEVEPEPEPEAAPAAAG